MAVMGAGSCGLELFVAGTWHLAARFACDDIGRGARSPSRIAYDFDYLEWLTDRGGLEVHDARALSCRCPTTYADFEVETWPAFLLDVIPSGAARRHWEGALGLSNTEGSDWAVLKRGACNPIGNVRVAEAAAEMPRPARHPGFDREDVLARKDRFIEYAKQNGAPVTGGSGAGGDAPKFMLREDRAGRWHADGAIDDARTSASWIVKFPRSTKKEDRLVLEAEAGFYRVASELGARVHGPVTWERDCLFVRRFDRAPSATKKKTLRRLGVESLYAIAGVTAWDAATAKEDLASALARFATDPARELKELLLRDVLDVALGNTDNHGRNTAVLKHDDGRVELSPLFDFAPMVLDPQGIARVSRWRDEQDGYPIWSRVVDVLAPLGLPAPETKRWLHGLAAPVRGLPKALRRARVPASVVATLDARIVRVAQSLEETRP